MLQFLTCKSSRYSIAEEAQMAIEGGCKWIGLTSSFNHGDSLKELAMEIKPLCEEAGVFLVIDSDVELCNDLRIHGVHLKHGDMSPSEARELLGPHAVIGVDVDSVADIIGLRGLDIDYCVLSPFGKLTVEDYRMIVAETRAKEMTIPIVARGDIKTGDLQPLLEAGVNGFAISNLIADATDPVAETARILKTLTPEITDAPAEQTSSSEE